MTTQPCYRWFFSNKGEGLKACPAGCQISEMPPAAVAQGNYSDPASAVHCRVIHASTEPPRSPGVSGAEEYQVSGEVAGVPRCHVGAGGSTSGLRGSREVFGCTGAQAADGAAETTQEGKGEGGSSSGSGGGGCCSEGEEGGGGRISIGFRFRSERSGEDDAGLLLTLGCLRQDEGGGGRGSSGGGGGGPGYEERREKVRCGA